MNRIHKRVLIALPLVAFALAQACGFLSPCSDEMLSEVFSPDERWVASIFVRNCGATTDFATRVEVRWRSNQSSEDDRVFVVNGKPEVHVHWLDESTLAVKCEECVDEDIRRRMTKLGSIKIEFEK